MKITNRGEEQHQSSHHHHHHHQDRGFSPSTGWRKYLNNLHFTKFQPNLLVFRRVQNEVEMLLIVSDGVVAFRRVSLSDLRCQVFLFQLQLPLTFFSLWSVWSLWMFWLWLSLGLSSFVGTRQSLIIGSSSDLAAEVCSSELETNTGTHRQPPADWQITIFIIWNYF